MSTSDKIGATLAALLVAMILVVGWAANAVRLAACYRVATEPYRVSEPCSRPHLPRQVEVACPRCRSIFNVILDTNGQIGAALPPKL